jgi:LPS-assembly protein
MCLLAEKQEQLEGGHFRLLGLADIRTGDVRIQADQIDFYQSDGPPRQRRIVAEGNVVFMKGDERLAGDKLDMDLETHKGTFHDALGYMSSGVLVEGRKIERLDANSYRIEGGRFTSCTQPNPRWRFSASSAVLDVDEQIKAKNVVFKVKGAPVFYFPYFIYPIQEDQRSTGLLFPTFGYSSRRGVQLSPGVFWAMGRSADQTFYFDHYSRDGFGLAHELRYVRAGSSRGTFRSYYFKHKLIEGEDGQDEGRDYYLDYSANQTLPLGFRSSLSVSQYSSQRFQQTSQDAFNLASQRTKRAALNIQRTFGATTVQALVDSTEFFSNDDRIRVNRHLPRLRVGQSPQKIKRTGLVYSYDIQAETLGFGAKEEDPVNKYHRFDVNPRLSRPLTLTFLQLTPEVQVRYTRYGASFGEDGFQDGVGLTRRYFESSVESRGPTFSRVFNAPGNFYSKAIKHVIGPEVTYTYRSAIDAFDEIPKLDQVDYAVGTNELRYGLMQRLYAKRPGASGKLEPYEFFNWRLSQTYYGNVDANLGEFDPYYSNFTGEPARFSFLQSRMRFIPTREFGSSFNFEYDVEKREMRSLGLDASADYSRASLRAAWSRSRPATEKARRQRGQRDYLSGTGRLQIVPRRFTVEGGVEYDLLTKTMYQSTARARYDVQCCGFMVEVIKYNYNLESDRKIHFAISLANVGSVGNGFMGQDEANRSGPFGGR